VTSGKTLLTGIDIKTEIAVGELFVGTIRQDRGNRPVQLLAQLIVLFT